MTGCCSTTDTNSSNRRDTDSTHCSADEIARTSSCQVSTPPTNSAWNVVRARSDHVIAVAAGQADHSTDAAPNAT